MAPRNWTTCGGCGRKMNKKSFSRTPTKVCYACHHKELKDKRKGITRGKNRR